MNHLNAMQALTARYAVDLLSLHQLADAWLDTQDEPASGRLARKLSDMRENLRPTPPPPGYLRLVTAEGNEQTIRADAVVVVGAAGQPGIGTNVAIRLVTGQVIVALGPKWVIEEAMRLALTPAPEVTVLPFAGRALAECGDLPGVHVAVTNEREGR